jgi:hypothetical protein
LQFRYNPERVRQLPNPFRVRRLIQLSGDAVTMMRSMGILFAQIMLRFETAVTAVFAAKCGISL